MCGIYSLGISLSCCGETVTGICRNESGFQLRRSDLSKNLPRKKKKKQAAELSLDRVVGVTSFGRASSQPISGIWNQMVLDNHVSSEWIPTRRRDKLTPASGHTRKWTWNKNKKSGYER